MSHLIDTKERYVAFIENEHYCHLYPCIVNECMNQIPLLTCSGTLTYTRNGFQNQIFTLRVNIMSGDQSLNDSLYCCCFSTNTTDVYVDS